MSLTDEIKEYARHLGFCKIGITTAQKFERAHEEADLREGYDCWKEKFEKGADPRKLLPGARSVLVLAYDYAQCAFPEKLLPMIGRAYLSGCYLPQPGTPVYERLQLFEDFLRQKDITFISDHNTLLMRPAAERAGVASFGRNNFSYVDGVGSFVILYGYVTDRELDYDSPAVEDKCPPGCRACINACPTKALYAPYKLDPAKCIGYNNWIRREGRIDPVIPRDIRSELGCHIHGCDVCQEVCPHNKEKLTHLYPADEKLEKMAEEFTLEKLLHMPERFYEKCVRPIMYHYLKDKKYFQRNAAIAMGNSKNTEYVPHLIKELSNPHEIVRQHVVWALGETGDDDAMCALRQHVKEETCQAVVEEAEIILKNTQAGIYKKYS